MNWRIVIRCGVLFAGFRRSHGRRRRVPLPPPPAAQTHAGDDVDEALLVIARMIYERTYMRSWRHADFWTRTQILQTARALLETLDVREVFEAGFAAQVRGLANGRQTPLPPCAVRCAAAGTCDRLPADGWPDGSPIPLTSNDRVPGSRLSARPVPFGPSGCPAE